MQLGLENVLPRGVAWEGEGKEREKIGEGGIEREKGGGGGKERLQSFCNLISGEIWHHSCCFYSQGGDYRNIPTSLLLPGHGYNYW